MIATFGDKATALVFLGERPCGMSADLARAALRKLQLIEAASVLEDLRALPGNRLERLKGTRSPQHSIGINDQWRITFAWRDGAAYDARIEGYHEEKKMVITREDLDAGRVGFSGLESGEHIPAATPGAILAAEFLEPLGLSARALARDMGVPTNRVTAILHGQRAITADTAVRLGHSLGTSAEFWMNLQSAHDLRIVRAMHATANPSMMAARPNR